MFQRILFSTALIGLMFFGSAFAADKYEIDQAHSYVGFSVRHMVISNVKGNFTDFSGTIMYDENDMSKSSANVKIKVASIDTDNENRDEHLRNADFFDAEKYPEMIFESYRLEKKGNDYIMHGYLTMHGVRNEISVPFEILGSAIGFKGEERIGFEGSAKVNRKNFEIAFNALMETGGLVVGDEVKIDLQIEAVKVPTENADSSK